MSTDAAPAQTVRLITSDNQDMTVDRQVAERSILIKNLLEDLGGDGNGRVDRVGDDKYECFWAVLGNALDETLYDTGVDLEEIVTGHTRLA